MASILIVEDSVVTAQMEAKYLGDNGHECHIANTGDQALSIFETTKPDLVLLDYMLPDLNGLEVLKKLLSLNPDILVVMVTGQGYEELAAEVMKAGARDYVVKTHKFFEPLVHVIERVLKEDRIRRELEEKARINERLGAQNELTYWVAHNFRNLFSGAIGFLQLIDFTREDQTTAKRIRFQQNALTSLNRASKLVDQLLNLTEVVERPPDTMLLKEVIEQARFSAYTQFETTGGKLSDFQFESRADHLPLVHLNARDMRLVLENLILNGLEALENGGKIIVAAEIENKETLVIRVMDNGRGMTEATRKQALEPLFSTKGTVGVGLGLSLVQAALRRQNADMSIESSPDQGTTVTVRWPISKPAAPPTDG